MMRFLYRVRPQMGESLAGYLLNLSNQNGYTFPQLMDVAGVTARKFSNPSDFLYQRVKNLAAFAQLIDAPTELLNDLSYRTTRQLARPSIVRFQGSELPYIFMRGHRSLVCPKCLGENNPCMADWDMILGTRCHRHHLLLVDTCLACHQRLTWHRGQLNSCPCGQDLCKLPTVAVPLLSIPSGEYGVKCIVALMAFQISYASGSLSINTLRDIPVVVSDPLIARSVRALELGEQGVKALVRKIAKARARRGGALGERWPTLPLLVFNEFGCDVRAWLCELANGCQVRVARSDQARLCAASVTLEDAKVLLAQSAYQIRKQFKRGIVVLDRGKGQGACLLDAQSIAEIYRKKPVEKVARILVAPNMLSVSDAAIQLGIYPDALRRVIKAGWLSASVGPSRTVNIAPHNLDLFQRQYVFARELAHQWDMNVTNLAERLRAFGCVPVSGPNVDGGLVYLFLRADVAMVDKAKLENLANYVTRAGRPAGRVRADKLIGYLTAQEVGRVLGISVQQVAIMVHAGLLHDSRPPDITSNRRYITEAEFHAYLAAYRDNPLLVRLDSVAEKMGITVLTLETAHVRREGLKVVCDGLHRYLLLDEVDAFLKRCEETLTSAQAADLLGVKRHFFVNQVALGLLKPVSGPGVDDNQSYRFTRSDIISLLVPSDLSANTNK